MVRWLNDTGWVTAFAFDGVAGVSEITEGVVTQARKYHPLTVVKSKREPLLGRWIWLRLCTSFGTFTFGVCTRIHRGLASRAIRLGLVSGGLLNPPNDL